MVKLQQQATAKESKVEVAGLLMDGGSLKILISMWSSWFIQTAVDY